ncbi:MAG: TIGR00269 family protein [Candidatus Aenigmarchaeota archaeon CG_4_10_14_0_8_um_filter_37_24]|nr:TIGR00269 family protein [Candidatus Aenigmarchaeota archaeon]OIN88671.1 MAG: TIGR00269 family protein [Candidatus Aenigmarchaeota archaeon CG1_02_38_14]PIV68067.1 MAG: TIGR00269 family protein [Candidatus Aenigmarchaeota archaeon CG01_land_8_20_14_3_00_37_9]PIW41273.1 MAG: TIGR00269 family protein [Candidatus Aenigmarchaeota archaeon CG15_BIG_FIL_POST_REV_8_21_14_020_37_27]PIX50600.1 MAG: TIGR00269 family protein [Candidatus Aenigmarchaeota archaeon CG_4_8_14_3_um_filter_37_24]PIY35500.1 M
MKCSFCSKQSIYFRENEGHYFCENHFSESIEKKVRKNIRSNNLIGKKDKIAVALSGGKDSSSTLFLLKKIFKNNPNIEIIAITIDQGFGCVNEYNAALASGFCQEIGVKHHIFSFKQEFKKTFKELVRKNPKSSYCSICGVLRRYLINKKVRELGCTKLATGHNLDDECQSILMNVIKGDMMRLARTGAMPMMAKNPKFIPRIKPLFNIPESEVLLFAKTNKIKFSGQSCPFAKFNSLRGETEQYLNNLEKKSPGVKHSLLESALKLKPHVEKQFKKDKIKLCEKCKEPASKKMCKTCEVLGGVLS